MPTRIALIHATPVAMQPVIEAFHHGWQEAETVNVLDDALSVDLVLRQSSADGIINQ